MYNDCFLIYASINRYRYLKTIMEPSALIHCPARESIFHHLRTRQVDNVVFFVENRCDADKNEIWHIKKQFYEIPLIVVITFADYEFARFCGQVGIEKILSQDEIQTLPFVMKKYKQPFHVHQFIKGLCPNLLRTSELVIEAVEIMEMNYLNLHTIHELCVILGVSNALLSKEFHKYQILTPKRLLDSLKMHHAASLLKNRGLQISEVSNIIGMADAKRFNECFHRIFHVSPGEFRKTIR